MSFNTPAVKTYSLRRDGDKQLSPNFRVREFASRDGSDKILICDNLVRMLQTIRDHFGVPVSITSGYRSPRHNAAVGGASNSQHVLGTAADITVRGITPRAIAQYAEWLGAGGIGLYLRSNFTHVDTRRVRSRWTQNANGIVVNTPGGFPGFIPPPPTQPEEDEDMAIVNELRKIQGLENVTATEVANLLAFALRHPNPTGAAEKEFDEAVRAGISDGSNRSAVAPRWQTTLMAYRASKRNK